MSAKDDLLQALVVKVFGNPDERPPDVADAFAAAFPKADEADEPEAEKAPAKGAK